MECKSIEVTIIKNVDIVSNRVNDLINKIVDTFNNVDHYGYIIGIYLDIKKNIDEVIINEFCNQLINIRERKNIIDLSLYIKVYYHLKY